MDSYLPPHDVAAEQQVLGSMLLSATAIDEASGILRGRDFYRLAHEWVFDAIVDRPWLGAYALRNTAAQPNSLRLYERIGEETMRLPLSPRQRFHATSAVVGFVIGTAADMGQEPPAEVVSGEMSREEYMARATAQWRALDPADFPFLHHVVDEFDGHDDRDQFRAGLELLLAGLELLAAGGQS